MLLPPLLALVSCSDGVGVAVPGPGLGESCASSSCRDPLVCGHDATCQEAGTYGTSLAGEDCSASAECALGLVCSSANECTEDGAAGTGGAGDPCEGDAECQAGHFCDGGACADIGIPAWTGGDCPGDADTFYASFVVDDLPVTGAMDFYGMPYPNAYRDARGALDLSGHPDPGDLAPEVGRLLERVEALDGYSLQPVIHFRFSQEADLSTLVVLAEDATIHFASIDDSASDEGELGSVQFRASNSRGQYVCDNWLALAPYDGRPLLPNHTYAAWVTTGVRSKDGDALERDAHFARMMQESQPMDGGRALAWDDFLPFREYVARAGLDASSIAAATVFTTADPTRRVRYFDDALDTGEARAEVFGVATCDASPCGRPCYGDGAFSESHAIVSLPLYAGPGQDLTWDTSLHPVPSGSETACALVVTPAGEPPAAGWPAAVYMGDVGRGLSEAIDSGLAAELAAAGIALVAVERTREGSRGDGDPEASAWLVADLASWRGAIFQDVADGFSAIALAADGGLGGLDAANVWVVGSGEGANAAASVLAWSYAVRGGVLANASGVRTREWISRVGAADLAHPLQATLADSALDRFHPLVARWQDTVDGADPALHAGHIVVDSDVGAKDLLVLHGVEDAEVAVESLHAFLRATWLPVAGRALDGFAGATTPLPVSANIATGEGMKTGAIVQVAAGHDPIAESAEARGLVVSFLASEGAVIGE